MEAIDSLCRVCLTPQPTLAYNIFTSVCGKRKALLFEMMAKCTSIKPLQNDGLPKLICKDCNRRLKRSYTFNHQCETSERKLKKLLAKSDRDSISLEEKVVVKEEDGDAEKNGIIDIKDEEDDIKMEPTPYLDDYNDCWDAEDDHMLLTEIRSKKLDVTDASGEIQEFKTEENLEPVEEKKIKKKRGRKKKGEQTEIEGDCKMPHQCDICGKFLSTKSNLKAHKVCHTDQRPYTCADCPASFRGYSALFQHRKVHSGETPYHCEYCPKQFSRRTGLVNHIRVHTGEKLFSCDICFKNFTQSAQLSIHMKRHKGDKSFLCQDCGKGFPIRSDLKVHQRIHNGEKPYSCHMCTKTFATSGNLSIHVRIHNKEIRYHCKECSRGFVTCSAFNIHVKRHKNQRDYQCECGKTFFTSSALKQHKVVHTGEKKYQCKICDRKFSQTSHLSRHFKKDHIKPNAPVPPSDHYKLVVPLEKVVFRVPLRPPEMLERNLVRNIESVKCEST